LMRRVQRLQHDLGVPPAFITRRRLFACVDLERVLTARVWVRDPRMPHEKLPALSRSGRWCSKQAVRSVWDLRLHGVTLYLGNEHARLERWRPVPRDPLLGPLGPVIEASLLLAEPASSRSQRGERHAGLEV